MAPGFSRAAVPASTLHLYGPPTTKRVRGHCLARDQAHTKRHHKIRKNNLEGEISFASTCPKMGKQSRDKDT